MRSVGDFVFGTLLSEHGSSPCVSIMSIELENTVKSYDEYLKVKGIDDSLLDAYRQAVEVALLGEKEIEYGLNLANRVKSIICDYVKQQTGTTLVGLEKHSEDTHVKYNIVDKYYEIQRAMSYWDFESYISYMEKERPQEKRFYLPRKKTLHVVAQDLVDLDNRKIKYYGLSLPSRTGKSTLCIFYMTWIAMKRPNSHSAMGGHSGTLVKGFYKELLNLFTSEEYKFADLFTYWHPNCEIIQDKSAEDYTINLDKRDRFSTITCRGCDATWTGAVDVSRDGLLYVDDMVRDREHSLSPNRMENTYQEYLNKMVDRKNDGAVELNVGTLWSVLDPMERMRVKYEGDPQYRFRRIPALDENDHSNFDYAINGFSTQYYIEMRERLDEAEWMAKYQQRPFVREGLLFQREEMLWWDGIMPDENHKTIAICDPAVGGGDALSMPICWVGDKKYIIDWVFNKGTQKVTVPLIVDKIQHHYITELYIEKNGVGRLFEDEIKRELARRNINHCSIRTYSAPTRMSKEDKIRGYSDWIKSNLYFLLERKFIDDSVDCQYKRSEEYSNALMEMHMYTSVGKNPHDDAPDSLSQMAQVFEKEMNGKIEVISNPFRMGF